MAESEADKSSNISAAKADAAAASVRSWTKTILGSLAGFILASGVVGTVISVYFQGRSWEYQNGTDKIAKDAAAVVSALGDLDKIIDEKWLSTYEMDDAVKSKAEGDKLNAVIKRFYSANKDWEQQHEILASTLQIAVDSQFGIDDPKLEALANSVDCRTYALKGQQPNGKDPLSVRALLEISYNCHNMIKGKIDEQLRAREANNSNWPGSTAEPDPDRLALSHIWWVDKVLQCMMVERALELRHKSPQVPVLPIPKAEDSQTYVTTPQERGREEQCLEPYKINPTLGIAASKSK